MADLTVNIAGVEFKNPVITASGTFGFGREYSEFYPLREIGGLSCKGITLKPRMGNPPPRIAETPSGILNAVGLQNPGVDHFIERDLPWLKEQETVVIANIAGNTPEEYAQMAEKLSESSVDMIEMNISCPNVKHGGVQFGTSCQSVGAITREVRAHCKKPLMVKLSPNVSDIAEIARAAEGEGADALSLINTLTGMRIDINTRRPIIRNNTGGLSGRVSGRGSHGLADGRRGQDSCGGHGRNLYLAGRGGDDDGGGFRHPGGHGSVFRSLCSPENQGRTEPLPG